MWRYRDARAFRPTLIDAGHVTETIALLLGHRGISTKLTYPLVSLHSSLTWLEEPEVALLVAGSPGGKAAYETAGILAQEASDQKASFITNPSLYLTFVSGRMRAHVMWPCARACDVDEIDFEVLNHCLPSRRGDRDTSVSGICKTIAKASAKRIKRLIFADLLSSSTMAQSFYAFANRWIANGWYLSLLAHLDVRSDIMKPRNALIGEGTMRTAKMAIDLRRSLLSRRTTRVFSNSNISSNQLLQILREACSELSIDAALTARIFVGVHKVRELNPGLFEWCARSRQFKKLPGTLTRRDVRDMVIGQQWAAAGAATIWIVRRIQLLSPRQYEIAMIELGSLGQRISLAATDLGLGVFGTPAVSDRLVHSKLRTKSPIDSVVYMFTVGVQAHAAK